jgi:hypothetical protein
VMYRNVEVLEHLETKVDGWRAAVAATKLILQCR